MVLINCFYIRFSAFLLESAQYSMAALTFRGCTARGAVVAVFFKRLLLPLPMLQNILISNKWQLVFQYELNQF
jgi:hypothetical protein